MVRILELQARIGRIEECSVIQSGQPRLRISVLWRMRGGGWKERQSNEE